VFVTGAARGRLKDALFRVADHEAPHIPRLPTAFEHYRYELGAQVYGAMGIPFADTARHAAAVMRNFNFFGAPLAGSVTMHRDLGPAIIAQSPTFRLPCPARHPSRMKTGLRNNAVGRKVS